MIHQKLFVEPTTLYFPPPLSTRNISNSVTICNHSKEQCIFKLYSNAPEKRFIVKPSSGILAPGSSMRVNITHLKISGPINATGLGKNLILKVQGKVIPPSLVVKATSSAGALWKECGDVTPLVMNKTLVCNFSGEVPNGVDVSYDTNTYLIGLVYNFFFGNRNILGNDREALPNRRQPPSAQAPAHTTVNPLTRLLSGLFLLFILMVIIAPDLLF